MKVPIYLEALINPQKPPALASPVYKSAHHEGCSTGFVPSKSVLPSLIPFSTLIRQFFPIRKSNVIFLLGVNTAKFSK